VLSDKEFLVREHAEGDLEVFIKLIAPKQLLGHIHSELIQWMTRQGAKSHQLILLPRDHQKSRMIAYRTAWEITKKPWLRVLYISSTSGLAEKQLSLIKTILTSPIYRRYWPEMIHKDEGKRERWTISDISVDHPLRKEEGVAEPQQQPEQQDPERHAPSDEFFLDGKQRLFGQLAYLFG